MYRIAIALGAAATALAFVPAAASARPAAVARPAVASSSLMAVTGSSDELVYTRTTFDPYTTELLARSAAGATTDLGPAPEADYVAVYSMSGSQVAYGNRDSQHGERVSWWNLAAGTRGTITLPAGDVYLAAAPTGFVFARGSAVYLKDTATRANTVLGVPFPGIPADQLAAASGPNGFVISGSGNDRYQQWNSPARYRTLGGSANGCDSVVGGYAACASGDGAVLLPLDGRPAVSMDLNGSQAIGAASVGSTLVADAQSDDGDYGNLYSRTYDSPDVSYTYIAYDQARVVAAYGRAIVASKDMTRLLAVTSATSTPVTVVRTG